MLAETFSEPGLVRAGTADAAEHGLGAGASIGRRSRVRPLERLESSILQPKIGAPTKAEGLCGEAEMPSHWWNFLLAGNVAVWLVHGRETRWYRVNFVALGVFQGRFFFLGGNSYE